MILVFKLKSCYPHNLKNSEYDQEIPQSQTADNPLTKPLLRINHVQERQTPGESNTCFSL